MVEAEDTCSFQQDDFVVQRADHIAHHKLFHTREESFISNLNIIGMRHDGRTDTYQTVDAALLTEVAYLTIEFCLIHTHLLDITENQGATAPFVVRAAIHEIEGNIQRVDIRIVRVVDQRTATNTLLHFQAHGNRFQLRHTGIQILGTHTQIERYSRTSERALNRRLVDKGQMVGAARTFISIGDTGLTGFCGNISNKQRCRLIFTAPPYLLSFITRTTDAAADCVIVTIVSNHLGSMEELELLHAFFLHRTEVTLVSGSQIGQYTDGGLDDIVQRRHLIWFADTGFEKSHLRLFIQQPNRERYAYL